MTLADSFQVQVLRAMGGQSRFVRTVVGRAHVIEVPGKGALPPVLLLHGITASAADWYPLIRRIRAEVRGLVAVDMPGHGLSEVPSAGLTSEAMHRGLLHALQQVGDEPMVVVGSSMGGLAAVRWANVAPERVRALFLLSPAGGPWDDAGLQGLRRTFDLRDFSDAAAFIDRAFRAGHPLRPLMAWGLRERTLRLHVRQLLADLRPADLLHPVELRDLSMPVLLSWGQQEAVLPREHLAFWRRHLPGHAAVEEPLGQGHVPFVTHADEVARRLLAFLADLPPHRLAA
ncbi:alpha/beta fold hydrolase [Myxococcota bacterium]|nr:alpha/beta fold hydrolase [Myxococcota bacterium]